MNGQPKYTIIDKPIYRLINTRFPTIGVFDDLADTESELRDLFSLEMMTNGRLNELGRLEYIPKGEAVHSQTGANQVMAAYTHCHDDGGRFNSGKLGVWYASLEISTAIKETVYHLTKRLKMSDAAFPQTIQMRCLITHCKANLLDLTDVAQYSNYYHDSDYTKSQSFGDSIRWPFVKDSSGEVAGEDGLIFNSIRENNGTNICIFKPKALDLPIIQGHIYQYSWDKNGKIHVSKLEEV